MTTVRQPLEDTRPYLVDEEMPDAPSDDGSLASSPRCAESKQDENVSRETIEGLHPEAFALITRLPPEILRGKYTSVPHQRPKRGLDRTLPPLSKINEIFDDIAIKAKENGIEKFLDHIGSRKLRVATMCSGTESPLLALEMLTDSFQRLLGKTFRMHHLFSAEIDPFKQSYIQRNFSPDIIFRDVNELVAEEATTAFGSLRKVPTDPDLLVVGFSCVDFSNLNVHRKTLEQMGESGHTFFAVLRYMERCRPALAVLENVSLAPWDQIREAFQAIDYQGYDITVDTKNYYLPQTRERGYMLCIDQRKLVTPSADRSISPFAMMMMSFRRAASCPITEFVLKNDDPRLKDAMEEISTTTVKERQAIDWTRYKARHMAYRMEEGLGNKRPLTKWQDNGTCQMPDFYWHDWCRAQTERVWDTLDVNYLRTVVRGYDINYKTRVVDLSQGLDRELDHRAFGVAGCLTPRGLHFITSRGGPLLGIEALALQGIPIDRLLLGSDSQRALYDLAGNAMSSTVVGAAILSALIIGREALEPGPTDSLLPDATPMASDYTENTQTMTAVPVELPETRPLSVTELIEGGKRSARLCLCEGQALCKRSGLLRCSKCGHTACKSCGRNPLHSYRAISKEELGERILPAEFERQLKTRLPMRLRVDGLGLDLFENLRKRNSCEAYVQDAAECWSSFMTALKPALGEELRFCGITRDRTWVVSYEGSHSVLKLFCSKSGLRWSLYVLPSKKEPSNSPLRQMLMRPVAWMVPPGDSLLEGTWHIRSPISSRFHISVHGQGVQVESLGSRAGLQHPHIRNSTVWSRLRVSASDNAAKRLEFDIRGTYELLQDCGAASGSLHKREISTGENDAVYLFLDPAEIGPMEFDSWVFAFDHERLDIGEVRDIIAEIRPNWSTFRLRSEPQEVICWYRERMECREVSLHTYCILAPAVYYLPDLGELLPSIGMGCKNSYIPLLSCSVPATGRELTWNRNSWNTSNLLNSPDMLRRFAWLLQRAVFINEYENWKVLDLQNIEFTTDCRICAPEKPRIMWALDERDRIRPFENPEDAALYEQSVKNRPAVFIGHTMVDDNSLVHFRICLNIATLLHQAIGRLLKPIDLSLQWRVCVDTTGFVRTRLPKLCFLNNKSDVRHVQPPGFKRFPLRPEQLRSLTWMVSQEADDVPPFEEEEVVEALLPVINWRAEGRASTKKLVKGGILGDDVGYGKTAISLGLIDAQFHTDLNSVPVSVDGAIPIKATLIIVPSHLVDQWAREITKFLPGKYHVLQLKAMGPFNQSNISQFQTADIVLMSSSVLRGASYYSRMEMFAGAPEVPKGEGRIFEEWLRDTMTGVREHVNVLLNQGSIATLNAIVQKRELLQNAEGLSKYRPSKRLKGQKLQEHLAKLKAQVATAKDEVDRGNAESASTGVTQFAPLHGSNCAKGRRGATSKDKEPPEHVPSAERIQDNSKGKAQVHKDTRANPDSIFRFQDARHDWRRVRSPLVHMFEFNRLIIDEFTYSKARNYASALAIPARKKWILSGTPPLNGFADVKSFSPFLGVNLGVDEDDYRRDNERLKAMQRERTDAEQFQPFVTRRSAAWHQRRHDVAQGFLNRFMRKNEPDIDEIPWTEHVCEVVLSPEERAVYLELFMQLMTQNLRIRKHGRGLYDSAEVARMDAIVGNSDSPEEALLKRCSLYALEAGATKPRKRLADAVERDDDESDDGGRSALEQSPEPEPDDSMVTVAQETLLEIRMRELINLGNDIASKLKLGLYLKAKLGPWKDELKFDAILSRIERHEYGDSVVTAQIQNLVVEAKRNSDPEKDEKLFYLPANEKKENSHDVRMEAPRTELEIISALNNCTDSLLRLISETITRTRAARLFQTVRCFQNSSPGAIFGCYDCRAQDRDPKGFYLLGECGHSVCSICLERCRREEQCQYPLCGGTVQEYRIIKWSDLGYNEGMSVDPEWRTYGSSKNAQLVKLLQDTTQIPEDDQVVLFVQFPEMIQEASAALNVANIPHKIISSSNRLMERAITEFQTGTEKAKSKVLILTLGDVTASGLNLQNANHIIFYSPLVARSQYDYESGMAQAIGRCRRYGQLKHVHIYHLLTLKTIEVNIFEQRRREQVVKRNGRFMSVPRKEVKSSDEVSWRGFSLEGTNAESYDESNDYA
ncbi:hypothetical protein VTO42DRAFT_8636 [Malbranchea cinnamomea]